MEQSYHRLKRSTLKDLLEARGKSTSSTTKKDLISELMEGDRDSNASSDATTLSEMQREVQWRMALYDTTPPQEVITHILNEVTKLRLAELQHLTGTRANPDPAPASDRRNLPYAAFKTFNEAEEEIDSFLRVFERQCGLQEIREENWVTILVSKLSGRALEAYQSMPDEDCRDYEKIKKRLLGRYSLTPEAHRGKFRASRWKPGQPFTDWGHRMSRAVDNWMEGCCVTTVAEAKQLIMLEHFFDYAPQEVEQWVRDRQPSTVHEATVLADQYMDARRNRQPEKGLFQPKSGVQPDPAVLPSLPKTTEVPRAPPVAPRRVSLRCYQCNQTGHVQANCPNNPAPRPWSRPTPGPFRAVAHCVEVEPPEVAEGVDTTNWGIIHEADPVQAANRDNRQHHRQEVWINGRPAQGLRDTGATITLVQPRVVQRGEWTGQVMPLRVAGGDVFHIPMARVHLDWGAGARVVEVGILDGLPAEVLLGNDLGHLSSAFRGESCPEAYPVSTRQKEVAEPALEDEAQTLFKKTANRSGCRVFIGRLNPAARQKDVERFFKGYGRIRDIDLKRGFGFVEFEDPRDADDAVYDLDGKELCHERVRIEHARLRSRGGGRGGLGCRRYSDRFSSRRPRNERSAPPIRTENRLIVENLSSRVSWQDLKDFMRQAGEVTFADAHRPKLNEGIVEFASYSDLKNAIEKLSGKEFNGRKIRLITGNRRHSRSRSRSPSRSSSRSPIEDKSPNFMDSC